MELALDVAKLVDKVRKRGTPPGEQDFNDVALLLSVGFKIRREEVAFLRLSADSKMLNFLIPSKLAKVGAIPLTSSHSLATKTMREKRGEIMNNFRAFKHLTIFESVDLSAEEKAAPIQKIMSSPMVSEGKILGVIQVCRKLRPGQAEGPDFVEEDLKQLNMVGMILGKLLAEFPAPR